MDKRLADEAAMRKRRIKLNQAYEESMNTKSDMEQSGIKTLPPPEINQDEKWNDANIQKQKAFESIKTIIKKPDEALKFLNNLDAEEIVPFNRFFSKFSSSIEGIDVKDATFMLRLWDDFQKKTVLNGGVPAIGTELEVYKNELQRKANEVLKYAAELGLDEKRISMALAQMVNDNDSASINKFYYKLLTQGPVAAREVFVEKDKEPSDITMVEEILPTQSKAEAQQQISELEEERNKLVNTIEVLAFRKDEEFYPTIEPPRNYTARKLIKKDLNGIIKNNLFKYVEQLIKINKNINTLLKILEEEPINNLYPVQDIVRKVGDHYLPVDDKPGLAPILEEKDEKDSIPFDVEDIKQKQEKAVISSGPFGIFDDEEIRQINNIMEGKPTDIKNAIMQMHPDGKFTLDGVKYSMKRNPPPGEVQVAYLLRPFMERLGVIVRPEEAFKIFKESPQYEALQEEKAAQMSAERRQKSAEKAAKKWLQKSRSSAAEAEAKKIAEADVKLFIERMVKEAEMVWTEASAMMQLTVNKTIKDLSSRVTKAVNDVAAKIGLPEYKFTEGDINSAMKNDRNKVFDLIPVRLAQDLNQLQDAKDRIQWAKDEEEKINQKLTELEGVKGDAKIRKKLRDRLQTIAKEIAYDDALFSRNKDYYNRLNKAYDLYPMNTMPIYEELNKISEEKMNRELNDIKGPIDSLRQRYDDIAKALEDAKVSIPSFEEKSKEVLDKIINRMPSKKNIKGYIRRPKDVKPSMILRDLPQKVPTTVPTKSEKKKKRAAEAFDVPSRSELEDVPFEVKQEERRGFEALAEPEPKGSGKRKGWPTPHRRNQPIGFGRYNINGRALGSGILDIRVPCGRTTPRLPRTPITQKLEKAIRYVIANNDIEPSLFDALSDSEKRIFIQAVEIAEINLQNIPFDVFKQVLNKDLDGEMDKIIERYHVLTGELAAGNNAPEILRELRGIIFTLLQKKKVDRIHASSLLQMINTMII